MEEEPSPLDQIFQNPDFKPFSGPKAFEVLAKANNKVDISQVDAGDLLKAVSSLGLLREKDVALMYTLQQDICLRCGACCSENSPMKVSKSGLKAVARQQRTGYKKIKKEIKARPNGDGTLSIRRNPCPFLKDNECIVYQARPAVCRNYPADEVASFIIDEGKYPGKCPIADNLLVEVVIQRALEEKMFHEDHVLFEEKRREDIRRLINKPLMIKSNYQSKPYLKPLSVKKY